MITDELIEILQRHPGLQVHLASPTQIAPANEVDKDHFGEDCGDAFVVVIGADWDEETNTTAAGGPVLVQTTRWHCPTCTANYSRKSSAAKHIEHCPGEVATTNA